MKTNLSISHGGELVLPKNSPQTLIKALSRAVQSDKGLIFVQKDKSEIFQSYKSLFSDAKRILGSLRKLGLKSQDKVILQIESYQDFIRAFWGCILGGFVPVPITSIAYTPKEMHKTFTKLFHTLQLFRGALLLTDSETVDRLSCLPKSDIPQDLNIKIVPDLLKNDMDTPVDDIQPETLAVIMLTSGRTGLPKGVLLTHKNLLSQAVGSIYTNGYMEKDVSLNWVPMDHVASLFYFHIRDIYLCSRQIHFSLQLFLKEPLFWLDLIEKHRVTITFGPNFAYSLVNEYEEQIQQGSWNLSSLKLVQNLLLREQHASS